MPIDVWDGHDLLLEADRHTSSHATINVVSIYFLSSFIQCESKSEGFLALVLLRIILFRVCVPLQNL